MPSRAVLPVIAEVNTVPRLRKLASSVTPEASTRAVSATSIIAMRSLHKPPPVIAGLRFLFGTNDVVHGTHDFAQPTMRREIVKGLSPPFRRSGGRQVS